MKNKTLEHYIAKLLLIGVLVFVIPYMIFGAMLSAILIACREFVYEFGGEMHILWKEIGVMFGDKLKFPWSPKEKD